MGKGNDDGVLPFPDNRPRPRRLAANVIDQVIALLQRELPAKMRPGVFGAIEVRIPIEDGVAPYIVADTTRRERVEPRRRPAA